MMNPMHSGTKKLSTRMGQNTPSSRAVSPATTTTTAVIAATVTTTTPAAATTAALTIATTATTLKASASKASNFSVATSSVAASNPTSATTSPSTSPSRTYTGISTGRRNDSKKIPTAIRGVKVPSSKSEKLSPAVSHQTVANPNQRQNSVQSSNTIKSGPTLERKSRTSAVSPSPTTHTTAAAPTGIPISIAGQTTTTTAVSSGIPSAIPTSTTAVATTTPTTGTTTAATTAAPVQTPRQQSARTSRIPTKNSNIRPFRNTVKCAQTARENPTKKVTVSQEATTTTTTTTTNAELALIPKTAITSLVSKTSTAPPAATPTTTAAPAATETTATTATLAPITTPATVTPSAPTVTAAPSTSPSPSPIEPSTPPSTAVLNLTQVIHSTKEPDYKVPKMQKNTSKSSFSSNSSNRSRTPSICLTARSASNSARLKKRSVSNASGDRTHTDIIGEHPASTMAAARQNQQPSVQHPVLPAIESTAGDMPLTPHERASEKIKITTLQGMEKKMTELQSEFLQKFANLHPTSRDKLKSSYKLVTVTRDNNCELLLRPEDLTRASNKLPAVFETNFKENIKKILEQNLTNYFDYLRVNQPGKDVTFEDSYLHLEKTQNEILQNLDEVMIELCSTKTEEADLQVCKLQKDLQDCSKNLKIADRKFVDLKKKTDSQLEAMEKECKEKVANEIKQKDNQLAELQKRMRTMEKQIEKFKIAFQKTETYASTTQIEYRQLQIELQTHKDRCSQLEQMLKDERLECKNKQGAIIDLQASLNISKAEIAGLQEKIKSDSLSTELTKRDEAIDELNNQVIELRLQKAVLEKKIDVSQREEAAEKLTLRQRLQEIEAHNMELQTSLKAMEEFKRVFENQPNILEAELMQLRNSDAERRREVDKLLMELSKAQYNVKQLEEQVQRDQQLLDVRSKLINSLQVNEKDQRLHMEELFAEVTEKNNIINELNAEIRTKSEEFRNLFNTISAKQLELSNQEHMVKLLEESNERSQMLRVKQEEKIARMEEEIAHLKHTIRCNESPRWALNSSLTSWDISNECCKQCNWPQKPYVCSSCLQRG